MSILPLGTTKTIFKNTFVYVDPQYIDGLGLWRVYPGIPETSDFTGLGAILPIVSTEISANSIKVNFDIKDLSDINSVSSTTSYLTAAHGLIQKKLPEMAPASQNIKTIKPVQHLRAVNKAVLYFNISSLEKAEIVGRGVNYVDIRPEKYKVTVKGYNKNNGVNIDSEAPMVDEVIGSTATFSFDITTLPKV